MKRMKLNINFIPINKIFYLLFFIYIFAWGENDQEKLNIISKFFKPFDQDQIFYRYQTKVSGDKFLKEKVWTINSFKHFMAMPSDPNKLAAGQGLYIAEKPHTSAKFAPEDGTGTLIEVHIAKGTPSLDLTDNTVLQALKAKGMTVEDVYRLNPKAMVKYYGNNFDWWVAKTTEGISFQPFSGKNLSTEYITSHYNSLAENPHKGAYQTYRRTVDPILAERDKITKQFIAELQTILADDSILLNDQIDKLHEYLRTSKSIPDSIAIRKKAAVRMTTPSDFIKFMQPEFASISDAYKTALSELHLKLADDFLKLNPSIDQLHQYLKGSNSVPDIVTMRKKYAAKISTLQDFIKFMQPERTPISDAYKTALGGLYGELADEFLKHNPSIHEMHEYLNGSNSVPDIITIRKKYSTKITTPQDFLKFMQPERTQISDAYKTALSELLASSADDFLKLKPTAEQTDEYLRLSSSVNSSIAIRKKLAVKITTPSEFIKFMKPEFPSITDAYSKALSTLSFELAETFLNTKPSIPEIIEYGKNISKDNLLAYTDCLFKRYPGQINLDELLQVIDNIYTADQNQKLEIRKNFIQSGKLKTAEDFVKLVSNTQKSTLEAKELDKFLQKYIPEFLRLNPTADQKEQVVSNFHNQRLKESARRYVVEGKSSCYWFMTNLLNR